MRRALLVSIALAGALGPAGCGSREPSDEGQVRTTLATFARSVEGRDYGRLCDEVFAPALLEGIAKIGLPCEVAMRNSLAEVQNPQLTVGRVELAGGKASAEVRTSAEGQEPSRDTLELVQVGGAWKVSSLGAAPAPDAAPTPGR